MQAVHINSSAAPADNPFSASNPAPSSTLTISTLPIPKPSKSNDVLVQIKASTVIRDTLTWPEMYLQPNQIPGHDFAGVVVSAFDKDTTFKPGDEVYGMIRADRAGCWAEYVIATTDELAAKPASLSWAQAATLPLSALTAWQAIFHQAGITEPNLDSPSNSQQGKATKKEGRLLITGASGGVGLLLVQLAHLTSYSVAAATRSNQPETESLLRTLGADEVITYEDLTSSPQGFDIIIDTVGGPILEKCWSWTKDDSGTLVTIDSASYHFVEEHCKQGISAGKENVKAKFFIVEPSRDDLSRVSKAAEMGLLKGFVAGEYPLQKAREVYDLCHSRGVGRGKVVLVM